MHTDYRDSWPACYRTQSDAGLPAGPIRFADRADRIGAAVGWIFLCGVIGAILFL